MYCNMVILSSTAFEGRGVPRRSIHSDVTDPIYSTGVIIVPVIHINKYQQKNNNFKVLKASRFYKKFLKLYFFRRVMKK